MLEIFLILTITYVLCLNFYSNKLDGFESLESFDGFGRYYLGSFLFYVVGWFVLYCLTWLDFNYAVINPVIFITLYIICNVMLAVIFCTFVTIRVLKKRVVQKDPVYLE